MARPKKEETKKIELKNKNILLEEKIDVESLRDELKKYVDETVNKTFIEELEKTNKKIIREKKRKIIWKNIIIILLLLIIGFLLFVMYRNNYFDKFFNHDNEIEEKEKKEETKEEEQEQKEEKKEEKKEPTLDELKKEYGHLIDEYYVTDSSTYISDFYNGKLTSDMKMYMTLNSFDFKSIPKEEDYNIIKESTFKMMYEKLFDDSYEAKTFNYDDNKIRYVKQMESYMSEKILTKVENNIIREIKDIKVIDDKVMIVTVEGILKNHSLYNVLTDEEVSDYKNDLIINYEDELNTMIYTFKDNKLVNISK